MQLFCVVSSPTTLGYCTPRVLKLDKNTPAHGVNITYKTSVNFKFHRIESEFLETPCTKCTEIASRCSASAKQIISIICEMSLATQVKTRQVSQGTNHKKHILYSWEWVYVQCKLYWQYLECIFLLGRCRRSPL